jgi:hypothetical protein
MKNLYHITAIVLFALGMSSCNSTKILETYKSEDNDKDIGKVYVVGLTGEEIPEEKLANELAMRFEERGVEASASLVSFVDCECETKEDIIKLTDELSSLNYDAILTFTRVSIDQDRDITNVGSYDTPSGPIDYPYYNDYYQYYGNYKPLVYSKGYLESDTEYNLEASLFDLDEGDLIWVGETATTEPISNEQFAEGYAKTIVDKLIYEGLVQR